jgi:hypothetical protein
MSPIERIVIVGQKLRSLACSAANSLPGTSATVNEPLAEVQPIGPGGGMAGL